MLSARDRSMAVAAGPDGRSNMEKLFKWLDDCDDLIVALRVHARPLLVTALLLAAFVAVVGVVVAFGAADLLAAP
jgi:hypothetical protein